MHRHAAGRSEPAPLFLLERLSGVIDDGERRARALGNAARDTAHGTAHDSTGTARDTVSPDPARMAASGWSAIRRRVPGVGDLPVGGLGPMLARATAAARETAADVVAQAAGHQASGAAASAADAARSTLAAGQDLPGLLTGSAAGAPPTWPGEQSGATGASAAEPAAGSGTGETHGAGTGLAGQADELLEILEDRLIAELERRGGRFAGVF